MQETTISSTNYHANLLWHRFKAKDQLAGKQAYDLSAWEAKAASLDEREIRLKGRVEFEGDRASQVKSILYQIATLTVTLRPSQVKKLLPEKSASDRAAKMQEEKESSDSSTVRELKATMDQFMTRLTTIEDENKELHTDNLQLKVELTDMKLHVTVLQDKVDNLEKYQQTTVGVSCSLFPVTVADPKL